MKGDITMSSVLLSIQPTWCNVIASGKKTIEVRKSSPNLDTPFKCYIYCTKGVNLWKRNDKIFLDGAYNRLIDNMPDRLLNGHIIGEFICDTIYKYSANPYLSDTNKSEIDISDFDMETKSCLSHEELFHYEYTPISNRYGVLGWHISDLIIYNEPKPLSDFHKLNGERINKAPQSWCYAVEKQ